ncbi:unnamed protein product, partial [Amoebophrya sp. A120]|eukprot:GSA120T00004139001.1
MAQAKGFSLTHQKIIPLFLVLFVRGYKVNVVQKKERARAQSATAETKLLLQAENKVEEAARVEETETAEGVTYDDLGKGWCADASGGLSISSSFFAGAENVPEEKCQEVCTKNEWNDAFKGDRTFARCEAWMYSNNCLIFDKTPTRVVTNIDDLTTEDSFRGWVNFNCHKKIEPETTTTTTVAPPVTVPTTATATAAGDVSTS